MRLYLYIILIFFFQSNIAISDEKIAYIDLSYIINNSISGKSINTFINNIEQKKSNYFKEIENKIKDDENNLISKKNILNKKIYNEEVEKIKIRINNYKLERKNFNKSLDDSKIKYTNKLLEILNPIISEYVEKNSINMVLPKKIVIIGKKKLDITLPILLELDSSIKEINFNE